MSGLSTSAEFDLFAHQSRARNTNYRYIQVYVHEVSIWASDLDRAPVTRTTFETILAYRIEG
jgi:hypothetical protein